VIISGLERIPLDGGIDAPRVGDRFRCGAEFLGVGSRNTDFPVGGWPQSPASNFSAVFIGIVL
jgi:hypothetical protein